MIGLVELHGVAHAAAGRTQIIDGPVARHRQQPRPQGALLRLETLDTVPHAQEGLLHQILGNPGIPHYPEDERVNQAAVAVVQLSHGPWIAALQALDQFRVAFSELDREQQRQQHYVLAAISRITPKDTGSTRGNHVSHPAEGPHIYGYGSGAPVGWRLLAGLVLGLCENLDSAEGGRTDAYGVPRDYSAIRAHGIVFRRRQDPTRSASG